jgi:Zinc carboxypeptidase
MMAIKVISGFDGSCPHFEAGVKQNSSSSFTLFPGYRREEGFSEENSKQGGSRFYTKIENLHTRPKNINIIADWGIDKRTAHHDQGYIRFYGEEWQAVTAIKLNATQFKYEFSAMPGITELALFPEYNYNDCQVYIEKLKAAGVDTKTIGQSEDGRDIWIINLLSSNHNAKNFFIQARDHGYETAGSYCIEGMTELLLSDMPISRYLRGKFNFHIIPMTNPDGVFRGMSRMSREKGADMNRVHTTPDKAHDILRKTLDEICPKVHMNIHNWTNKYVDGLLANDIGIAQKILQHFPDDHANFKRWRIETTEEYLKANKLDDVPEKNKSWKNYCKENFDSYAVNFEFPWFAMLPKQMKNKGKKALSSFALAVIEEMNL